MTILNSSLMDIVFDQAKLSGPSKLDDEILCTAKEVQQELIAKVEDSFSALESKIGSSAEQPHLSIDKGQMNYEEQEHLRSNKYKFCYSIGHPKLNVEECYKNNEKDSMRTTQCKIGVISGLSALGVKEEQTQSKIPAHFESEAEVLCIAQVVLHGLITRVELLCNKSNADLNVKHSDVTLREGLINSKDNQEYLKRNNEYMNVYNIEQSDLGDKKEQIHKENNQEDKLSSAEWKTVPLSGKPDLEVKERQGQLKVLGLLESETEKLCKVNEVLDHLIKKVEDLCTENDTGTNTERPVLSKSGGQIIYENKQENLTRNNTYVVGYISEQTNLGAKEDQIPNYNNHGNFLNSTDWKTDPIFGKINLGVVEEKENNGNNQDKFLNGTEYQPSSSEQSELTVKEEEENENSQNSEPLNENIKDHFNNEEDVDVTGIPSDREPSLEIEVRKFFIFSLYFSIFKFYRNSFTTKQ